MKTIPIIGCDFVAEDGRITSFSLLREREGKSIAIVDFNNDKVVRCLVIDSLESRKPAIIRLARRYKARSIPQTFPHSAYQLS